MTLVYGILLTLTMISLLIAGVFGYLYRDAVDHYVEGQLSTSLKHWCHSNPEPWDSIQVQIYSYSTSYFFFRKASNAAASQVRATGPTKQMISSSGRMDTFTITMEHI